MRVQDGIKCEPAASWRKGWVAIPLSDGIGRLIAALAVITLMLAPSSDARETVSASANGGPKALLSAADLVRFREIGDPVDVIQYEAEDELPTISPDGKYAATAVRWGDLSRKENRSQIILFDLTQKFEEIAPRVIAEFASATSYHPVAKLQWLSDSKALTFAAANAREAPKIYRVDINGKTDVLTNDLSNLKSFEVSRNGKMIVANRNIDHIPPKNSPQCAVICRSPLTWLNDLFTPGDAADPAISIIHARHGSANFPKPASVNDNIDKCARWNPGGISPDERYVLQTCTYKRAPTFWNKFTGSAKIAECLNLGYNYCFSQIFLYDAKKKEMQKLNDTLWVNYGVRHTKWHPIWIDDGAKLVLPGTMDVRAEADAGVSRSFERLAVLAVDVESGVVSLIGYLPPEASEVTSVAWDQPSQTVSLGISDPKGAAVEPVHWRRNGEHWIDSENPQQENTQELRRFEFSIQQGLNERPTLVLHNRQTGERRTVLDPNEWLDEFALGKVEEITVRTKGGGEAKGALYFPVDYQPGKRYPLVLQGHGYQPRFSLWGVSRNFAAQAMAARGIMVLQYSDRYLASFKGKRVVGTPDEWPAVLDGYESAITMLDQRGLIDTGRIGLIGWSRTGPHIAHVISHSDIVFKAGAFTESSDVGWWYYMSSPPTWDNIESWQGGAPFGKGIIPWLENTPTFNLDRFRTPMLFWVGGVSPDTWDMFAGLHRLGIPVERWFTPNSDEHDVFSVPERIETTTRLVDWFSFWLESGAEQIAPERLAELREMREDSKDALAAPRRPLYKWRATPIGSESNKRRPVFRE